MRNTAAPIAYWHVRGSFESFDDCLKEAVTLFPELLLTGKNGGVYSMTKEDRYSDGVRRGYVCISSADPRLKAK